ncbi:hypothetical protein VMCG_06180 [Cytospora schulzeri]|uniref:RING-type E3 ubiquitin transferase n=1 Tax=Cytospora schulzeri TaxID=448051 RepID=A0A423W9C8_9PEZI|nr:hypothetical protein VMCG_06180 [Valsa malicola]
MDQEAGEAALENPQHDVVDLTSPSPEAGHPSTHRLSSGAYGSRSAMGDSSSQLGQEAEVIDLTSDSPEPVVRAGPSTSNPHLERALPNLPASASGSISSSHRSGGSGSSSGQRRPGTPPSPPPPVRRRTSSSNFGALRGVYQQQRPMESGGPSDVSLPRWQPDAEVTICPICHTQFSIFVRKHHCRKCGRVVCASCSPHRITIPYQYIVQPSGTPRPGVQRYSSYLPSSEGGFADFSSLGGEDECPVCHRELPAQDLPNYEALRETHINMCITAHSTYGGTPTGEGSSILPRRTGMFPYFATEKDCVDSAECTICLEEFEVGVPMARLECLCRFHRECISRWFAKNPGRCPVHQHDSHGF